MVRMSGIGAEMSTGPGCDLGPLERGQGGHGRRTGRFQQGRRILTVGAQRPKADLVVVVGLGHKRSVGTDRRGTGDGQLVVDLQQLAGDRVPYPDGVVGAGGDDVLTSRAVHKTVYSARVTHQFEDGLVRADVQHGHTVVPRSEGEVVPGRIERSSRKLSGLVIGLDRPGRGNAPYLHLAAERIHGDKSIVTAQSWRVPRTLTRL